MVVWTRAYRPFIMGGDVNGHVGVDVEVGEKIELGAGYYGYVVASPLTGKTFVAESETGALVGPSIEEVRKDIETGDTGVMADQIADAREQMKHVSVLPADEFWGMLK